MVVDSEAATEGLFAEEQMTMEGQGTSTGMVMQ